MHIDDSRRRFYADLDVTITPQIDLDTKSHVAKIISKVAYNILSYFLKSIDNFTYILLMPCTDVPMPCSPSTQHTGTSNPQQDNKMDDPR